MWRASRHDGCSERASGSTISQTVRHSSCSLFSITSAETESRGDLRRISRETFAYPGSGSMCRRGGFASEGCSSKLNRGGRGERRATDSGTRARSNLSSQTTRRPRQTCQLCGASRTSSTCRPTWLEGRTTYVSRSAHVHRLRLARPAHRPAGRFSSIMSIIRSSYAIGQLAARCPSGEEAQGDLTLRARQQLARHVPACSRLLPADDGELAAGSIRSAGLRLRNGWGAYQRNSSTRVKRSKINAADVAGSR